MESFIKNVVIHVESFGDDVLSQMNIILKNFPEYFRESPISIIFLSFLCLVFILNITKSILIYLERKRGTPYQSCEYLIKLVREQDCNHPFHRKRFIKRGRSCEKCRGKSYKMTDVEAENRVAKSTFWKRLILLLASYGNNILPYVSFIYTLIIAIYENNK